MAHSLRSLHNEDERLRRPVTFAGEQRAGVQMDSRGCMGRLSILVPLLSPSLPPRLRSPPPPPPTITSSVPPLPNT